LTVAEIPPAVALAIERFSPKSVSEEVALFSKELTFAAAPTTENRAKAFLFASSRIGSYAQSLGLDLDPAVVLHPSVIERFSSDGDMSPTTRRTLRTNLRSLAERVANTRAHPVSLPRERAKSPYSASEIASYLSLADAQPTALRRTRAQALICLGAGAGLIGGELRRVRGSDVIVRSGGVLVSVGGTRKRTVPVLSAYHDRLLDSAKAFSDSYLVAGVNPDSHNVTNPIIRELSKVTDLPRLETPRLRSTWLVCVSQAIGLRAFMEAAGVSCSQRLGDLVSYLDPPTEEQMVAVLGAST
jgi:integrase